MILIYINTIILRYYQHKIERKIDEKNITPSDFTLSVTNISKKTSKQELQEFFEGLFPESEFVTVNYCYDFTTIFKYLKIEDRMEKVLNYMISYRKRKLKKLKLTQ